MTLRVLRPTAAQAYATSLSFRILAAAFLILLPGFSTAASAAPYSLPKFSGLAAKNIDATALVVDLTSGRVLAQHNPDLRLTPASVSKLFIDAAALEYWGPGHRFYTRLYSNGPVVNGVLQGDLLLKGGGDPELTANRLWLLVMRLKQMGIRSVSGNLIINDSLFGTVPCDNKDRCEAIAAANNGYDAPLSSAGLGYSAVEITVFPGSKVGEKARIEVLPPGLAEFDIEGTIDTVLARNRPLYGVRRVTKDGREVLSAYGRVPVGGGPYRLYRSVSDPARHTGHVLLAMLKDSDIRVQGRLQVSSTEVPKDFNSLDMVQSLELSQILRSMMTFSNNYMADVLTLGIAARDNRTGNLTLPVASQKLEDLSRRANLGAPDWLRAKSTTEPSGILKGGSGLNPANKLSARDIVALMSRMHDNAELFPSFVSTLSIPEHVSSRMLRRWANKDWKTRIAVKTGYLSEPRSAIGVGGYFRLKNGGWGAFACIANGTQKRRNLSSSEAIGSCREDMQKILAQI